MQRNVSILFIAVLVLGSMISPGAAQEIYKRNLPPLQTLMAQKSFQIKPEHPRIGLVLSGGGARGISHIGVLKGLEKYDIPIDLIIGTSMGSMVGGFYAAGFTTAQLERMVRNIDWENIFRDDTRREDLFMGQKAEKDRYIITIRFDKWDAYIPTSISTGQKILSTLSEQLYQFNIQKFSNFDSLRIPFRAVATDLISGKRIVLAEGDLAEAIYGSTAVPLLFSPMPWDSMLLVDGGLSSNLAVDVARAKGMDRVILVDITSPLRTQDELKSPWEIADQVTTIMQQSQNQEQRELADIVIKPDLEDIGSTDFSRSGEMIAEGEKAVERMAGDLQSLLRQKQDSTRIFHPDAAGPAPGWYLVHPLEQSLPWPLEQDRYFALADLRTGLDSLFSTGIYREIRLGKSPDDDTILELRAEKNPVLRGINFSGNRMYSDSVLQSRIAHPLDTVLNYNTILKDLDGIYQLYIKAGYSLMNFRQVQLDTVSGILHLDINAGAIDSIRIEGNQVTRDYVITREFPLKAPSFFNAQAVRQGIQNIYDTQLFEKVTTNFSSENGINTLIIKVIEKKYSALRFGGQVGLDRGVQSYLYLGHDNFLGTGSNLSASGRIGEKDKAAGLNFRVDRVFKTYFTSAVHIYYDWKLNPYLLNRQQVGEYWEERTGGKLILGQQIKKLGQVNFELRLENVKDRRYSGTFNNRETSELRTLTIRSVTDKRDRIVFASRGIYNVWYWETGNERLIGGQEKYTKAYVNLEGFYTYWTRYTLHIRGGIGVADRTLPFSEYFRLGGIDEFMGLYEYEYSGRQLIYANFEFRYKLPVRIISDCYLALRYDLAGIWETPDLIFTGEDFFPGSGAWIGIDTFLGPLIAGYGKTRDRSGIFYLSFGYRY